MSRKLQISACDFCDRTDVHLVHVCDDCGLNVCSNCGTETSVTITRGPIGGEPNVSTTKTVCQCPTDAGGKAVKQSSILQVVNSEITRVG